MMHAFKYVYYSLIEKAYHFNYNRATNREGSARLMADIYKLAEQFGDAAIAIDDIYKFMVEPGAVLQNYLTEKNGFIITTKGNATVVFNGSLYHLSPGIIAHGTQNMTIEANVTSPTSWEY